MDQAGRFALQAWQELLGLACLWAVEDGRPLVGQRAQQKVCSSPVTARQSCYASDYETMLGGFVCGHGGLTFLRYCLRSGLKYLSLFCRLSGSKVTVCAVHPGDFKPYINPQDSN